MPDLLTESESSRVDVIVPVYRGLDETRRCLESVLGARQETPFDLVLVDDHGPEPALRAWLGEFAAASGATLLVNDANLGFVASVNRGMALHPDRDVVLLNSDTEVAGDWLDRLRRCALGAPDIGTATPFSNNATICSYPVFCADNPLPEDIDLATLDAAFRRANAGRTADIPSAVGFCMYIRRACLDAAGAFDTGAFGKGYGEENDFSRRAVAAGWRNVVCADTFVYHAGAVSFSAGREALQATARATMERLHPGYEALVRRFVERDPLKGFRAAVDRELGRAPDGPAGPVQLHVTHDLGGGAIKWLRDYSRAENGRINLVLKPWSASYAYGEGLALFADIADPEPIRFWRFETPIQATVVSHPEYRRIFASIVADFGVDAVIVSSLIGHALDALDSDRPTLIVCHDYYPYCPAINLYYDGVCQSCDADRLRDCCEHNRDYNHFLAFTCGERQAVREAWLERVLDRNLPLACPSASVRDNLIRLDARFAGAAFTVIPHGSDPPLAFLDYPVAPDERLRILVLGQMSIAKGSRLLLAALDELTRFADVFLLGCAEVGEQFRYRSGVHVIARYEPGDLPVHIANIRPHVGLLASTCAETYSYTLSELFGMGVPPVATTAGSFPERIVDGETGRLYEPTPEALVAVLRVLDRDRAGLAAIRENLRGRLWRSGADMARDYRRLLPLTSSPERGDAYRKAMMETDQSSSGNAGDPQAALLADMWKELKSLRIGAALRDDTHYRLDRHCRELERIAAERGQAIDRLEAERLRLEAENAGQAEAMKAREKTWQAELQARDAAIAELHRQVAVRLAELEAMRASTSWRLTGVVRWGGHQGRRLKLLGHCLGPVARHPHLLPVAARSLFAAWRAGGLPELKKALRHLPSIDAIHRAWTDYRRSLDATLGGLRERAGRLPRQPLISVLVPTYETPEAMLREMLRSVTGQIYPRWQLCIADDGSRQAHVRRILEEFAAGDDRIVLDFDTGNHGIAHASNRALALAEGEFTVLLDHDDLLEPQALLRVAEAIVGDDPDMLYSDEVLISGENQHVEQMVLRPVFSPEYLRAHPYIVHLAGFRTGLLREIGGFDESLAISQDYDLVLRASERARRIVHIPEVLYRWRINHQSAGQDKRKSVMSVSAEVLRRHLERCGETATVADGPGFNFFDVRYPLADGLKVAIVIPTKNHGELVRQCIDSLRRTIRGVAYDIVVIDHDSDDPATLAYLDGLAPEVTVLRYSGPFNFSKINNWAIARLPAGYSHYLLCNNDIEAIREGWLERMLELGQKPDVGIVGAMLYYPDGATIQHAGVCVGLYGIAEHYAKRLRLVEPAQKLTASGRLAVNHEMAAVTAACLLIRKEAYEAVGGLDEAIAVGFGDVDLCLKVLEQDYRILFCPHAELLHHESYTRGTSTTDPHPEDSAYFRAKWAAFLAAGDPYFHPGYTIYSTTWDIDLSRRFQLDARRRVFSRDAAGGRQRITVSPAAVPAGR